MATITAEAKLYNGIRLLCVDVNAKGFWSDTFTLECNGLRVLRTACGIEAQADIGLVDERYLTYGGKMDGVVTASLGCKFPTYMRFDIEALGVPEGIDIILQMEEGFVIEGDYPNSEGKPLPKVTNLMTFRTPKKGSLYPSMSTSMSIPGERRRPFSATITDAMSFTASGKFSPASGVIIDNTAFTSSTTAFKDIVLGTGGSIDQIGFVLDNEIYANVGFLQLAESVTNTISFTMPDIERFRLRYFDSALETSVTQSCDFERQIGPITASINSNISMSIDADRIRDTNSDVQVSSSLSSEGQISMVFVFDSVVAGTLQLPFDSTRQFSLYVDWGDGTITYHENEGGVVQHTYTSSGARTIGVWGNNLEKFSVSSAYTSRSQWASVREIQSWGEFAIEDMTEACRSLILRKVPLTMPSSVTTTARMFQNASTFNAPEISNWGNGMANVTDMSYMFYNCSAFNQNINGWNTSSVTNLDFIFAYASVFNQPLNNWNTSNVTRLVYSFNYASWFNQDISSWDTSNVLFVAHMFDHATRFNQPLNSWDVSKVQNFGYMFADADAFNQDLNSWVLTGTIETPPGNINYINMEYMFYRANNFNGNITGWDMSNVVRTQGMFQDADSFNQDISGWDTSRISEMNYMFYRNNAFNQDLSGWCVSLIPTTPTGFDTDATAWTQPRPVWGTCP